MPPDEFPATPNDALRIDRRQFLVRLEMLAAGLTCGALPLIAAGCAARAKYVTPTLTGERLSVPLAQVGATGGVLVEDPLGDLPIFLHRTADGAYVAVSTRCGHRGCQVEPAAAKLVCPCHGSEYTLDGTILQGPTLRPLERYRVTVDGAAAIIHRTSPETP
ncbi:MAG TPA: Rieske (2Fe-2S) protein [Gemmatimonadaceae bacterium]|nr:Rieske (2Fe-2S) protein [Gemmatimonadaceae bacterium]